MHHGNKLLSFHHRPPTPPTHATKHSGHLALQTDKHGSGAASGLPSSRQQTSVAPWVPLCSLAATEAWSYIFC